MGFLQMATLMHYKASKNLKCSTKQQACSTVEDNDNEYLETREIQLSEYM